MPAVRFDPLDRDAIWGEGDRVVYRVESNASGELVGWTLALSMPTLPEPGAAWAVADPVAGYVRVLAPRQSFAGEGGLSDVPAYILYFDDAALHVRMTREDTGEVFDTVVESDALAHVYSESVASFPDLGIRDLLLVLLKVDRFVDELMEVVQPPSVMSVILAGGQVRLSLDFQVERRNAGEVPPIESEIVDSPFGPVEAFWLPMTLLANGQPALECRFLITWRHSPLLPSAGVLRIDAHHPAEPERKVAAWLVEARRGRGAEPDRDALGLGFRRGMSEAEALTLAFNTVGERRVARPSDPSNSKDRVEVVELIDEVDDKMYRAPCQAVFRNGRLWYVGRDHDIDQFLALRGFEWPENP